MDANTQKGFQPDGQVKDVPEGVKKGRVLVISEVLFAVDSLADLPKGRFVVEAPNGDLKEFETGKIPTEKLMEGIAVGRVFAHWGSNIARLDELHPDWALSAISKPRRIDAFERQWPHSERAIRVASGATQASGPYAAKRSVIPSGPSPAGSALDDRSLRAATGGARETQGTLL